MRFLHLIQATPLALAISAAPVWATGLGDLASSAAGAVGQSADISAPVEEAMKMAFPGLDVPPYVPCVVKNVDAKDATAFVTAGTTGNYTEAANVAAKVAGNPETTKCIASAGLPALPQ